MLEQGSIGVYVTLYIYIYYGYILQTFTVMLMDIMSFFDMIFTIFIYIYACKVYLDVLFCMYKCFFGMYIYLYIYIYIYLHMYLCICICVCICGDPCECERNMWHNDHFIVNGQDSAGVHSNFPGVS